MQLYNESTEDFLLGLYIEKNDIPCDMPCVASLADHPTSKAWGSANSPWKAHLVVPDVY